MRFGEFDWKLASPGKGALSALLFAMKYLVVPFALIYTAAMALQNADGMERMVSLLQEMQGLVLMFGVAIIILGFFRGAYPKGSYSRFSFGLTISVLAIIYALSLLLGGRLEDAFSREFFELDLDLLFVLYFIPAIVTVLMQLGEFVDHRGPWLVGIGKAVPEEREDPEKHLWYHDFRLRYGSLYQGLKRSRAALVGFVIIPLMVIVIMKAGLSSLDVDQIDPMIDSLDGIASAMVLLGLPIAIISFPKGFYPRGSLSRMLPAVTVVLLILYWIWKLGMEGRFVFDEVDGFSLSMDYTGLLYLIMAGTALWIVYYILEMIVYRKEWSEGGFQKDLDRRRRRTKEEVQITPVQTPPQPAMEASEMTAQENMADQDSSP